MLTIQDQGANICKIDESVVFMSNFNHIGTILLETDRLILRRFVREDVRAMFENWASDSLVTKYLTWPTHENMDISAMVIEDWIAHYCEPDYYQWAIELKQIHAPIGSISVVHHNDRARKMEIGYCIGKKWWHCGITSEALGAVIRFLIDEVGAERVEACHDPRNPHSGDVMRKCGMRYEGTQRQAGINNSGRCHLSWYAILSSDGY